jgi:uncharacterized membrane protein YfcA
VDLLSVSAVVGAGVLAGMVNTIAGAGSLLTFPVLVAVGLTPLAANVTNDLGVLPGNISGAVGFREELRGQRRLLLRLIPLSSGASLLGAVLLLAFPARAFEVVAPVLLLLASAITLAQPALARLARDSHRDGQGPLWASIAAISAYGGYFGTGIGVLFFAALGVFVEETPPRLNATKQVLALVCNGVAGILFAFVAPVDWWLVLILGVSSFAGGPLGVRASRVIPAHVLRVVIATAGAIAATVLGVRLL